MQMVNDYCFRFINSRTVSEYITELFIIGEVIAIYMFK